MSRLGALWERLAGRRQPRPVSAPSPARAPRPNEYSVFTKAHDREIRLEDLDSILGPLSPAEQGLFELRKQACSVGLAEWQAEAHVKALIRRNKLASLATQAERAATCVTILLDLSGSMRDQRIMTVRGVLEVVALVPQALGIQFEILGFTTARWQGGLSRRQWIEAGKPQWPGRLNDLLHVVITDADVRDSARLTKFEQLLRPDLLKENIDGEAVEWACARLMTRKADRRALIVISDGAPVDDSTLQANDLDYLADHLTSVTASIQSGGDIALFGVGIDYNPARLYRDARKSSSPGELLDALFDVLEAFLARPPEIAGGTSSASDLEPTG
jgi:cobaltochelatase CobT